MFAVREPNTNLAASTWRSSSCCSTSPASVRARRGCVRFAAIASITSSLVGTRVLRWRQVASRLYHQCTNVHIGAVLDELNHAAVLDLGVALVPKRFVEVGRHGGVSYAAILPPPVRVFSLTTRIQVRSFIVAFETRLWIMSRAATGVLCSTRASLAAVRQGFGLAAGCYRVPHNQWFSLP